MENHISNEFYDHLKNAKRLIKEFKERSKELLKSCELVTIPAECMIDINKVILISDDLLDQTQKCMDHAYIHKQKCKNEKCKHYCDDIIYASKECIKALGNVEIECETDLNSCVDSVEIALDKTKELLNELDKFMENEIR